MPASSVPARHWLSYGDDPLPSGKEALDEPFRAFPSWFMRITCDRDLIAKLRHDGCGGRAGRVELLTGIEGASSRPVRKIVLICGWRRINAVTPRETTCTPW